MRKKLQKTIKFLGAFLFLLNVSVLGQSDHTITIDGTNDFNAPENLTTSTGGWVDYFTWDANNIYFGISGSDIDLDGKVAFIYIDTDPILVTSTGTTSSIAWSVTHTLPFTANYAFAYKTQSGDDYYNLRKYNGGWLSDQPFTGATNLGTDFLEVRIPRAEIGSPSKIRVLIFVQNDDGSWTWSAAPNNATTDGSGSHTFTHSLGYTLTTGLSPNDANAVDAILVNGIYGNSYALFNNNSRGCFRIADVSNILDVTDFTIETWVYIDESNASSKFVVDRVGVFTLYITSAKPLFNLDGLGNTITTSTALTLNAWYHIAVVGSGGTTTMFVNGTSVASALNTLSTATDADIIFNGQAGFFSNAPTSKIDEIRFSNTALYTGNFNISNSTPLGSEGTTIFYIQFENNAHLPPLDKGPLGLTTLNGETDLTNPLLTTNYIVPPSGLPLPVELTSLNANVFGKDVKLGWSTATEVNSYQFVVERNSNEVWNTIGTVNATGNSNSPKEYSFTDNSLQPGKYLYRLKMVDNDGSYEYSQTVEVDIDVPKEYVLMQNYPNPFNPVTNINYTLPLDSKVMLVIYSISGEKVAELVNETQASGSYSIPFNASHLASGTYVYRLIANDFVQTKKMLLIK